MEIGLIVLAIFVIFFIVAIIQNLRNPPRNIDYSELPEIAQLEIQSCFPEFEVESVRFSPAVREYLLKGLYKGNQVKIEAEMTSAGLLDELELNDMERRIMKRGAEIQSAEEIPESILKMAFTTLSANEETPQFVKAYHVTFSEEPGYKLKLKQANYYYEFEVSAEGRLFEFEKELCR